MKKNVDFKDFYSALKENLQFYKGEFDDMIYMCPELFKLLTDLLNEHEIKKDFRLKISAAIAYFVAPFDIIPEEIYGPIGYVDDIFLCCFVLRLIRDEYGKDILEKNWKGDGKIIEILDNIYLKSKKIIKGKEDEILKYVGLKE